MLKHENYFSSIHHVYHLPLTSIQALLLKIKSNGLEHISDKIIYSTYIRIGKGIYSMSFRGL